MGVTRETLQMITKIALPLPLVEIGVCFAREARVTVAPVTHG